MGHFFISYSHKDTEYAHSLAAHLQALGFEIWIDERLDYGSQWPLEIQKQLDSCDAFIIIMTTRSYESEWVQNELNRAKRLKKPIYPLLLEGAGPWLSVESIQFADVRDGSLPDEKFYQTLERVVHRRTGGAPSQAAGKPAPAERSIPAAGRSNPLMLAGIGAAVVIFLGVVFAMNRPDAPVGPPELERNAPLPTETPSADPTSEAVADSAIPPAEVPSPTTVPLSDEFTDAKGVAMVFVPAGNFIAGSDNAYDDEKPVHTVYLADFYMDKFEVTNVLYRACVDSGACQPPKRDGSFTRDSYHTDPQYDDYPVVFVDWEAARSYCAWRGMDLPSEAQWEKAARGTDGRTYPWGEGMDGTLANYNDTVGDTTAVGSYVAGKSPYGAYDMAGNAWEWVADWYSNTYYMSTPLTDPPGPPSGQYHVLRGGSWHDDESIVRTSNRGWNQLEYFYNTDFGFRCAMDGTP